MTFAFDNSYGRLPSQFYAQVAPTKVKDPRVVRINRPLAELLGLDPDLLASPEGAQLLSGNTLPDGAASIALAYAGHSSATSCLSSVMGAPSCSERLSARTGSGATSS